MSEFREKSELLSELQSDLGKALWQIQALEDTLAHLIAVVLKLPAKTSIDEAEAILDDVRKGTLGKLLNEVRKAVNFGESFEVFIKKFLRERNWLVHRSWREYYGVLEKENEYKYLRLRIRGLASDALEYNKLFAGFLEEWAIKEGIAESDITEIQKEFESVWGKET